MEESSRYAFTRGKEQQEHPPLPESRPNPINDTRQNEASPEPAKTREPASLGADYALLQEVMKEPSELTSSLVDAFHEKLIKDAVGADASNGLIAELKRQTKVRLDTCLTRDVPAHTAITKMTGWIKERNVALKKRGAI